jgi:hypothetical protein
MDGDSQKEKSHTVKCGYLCLPETVYSLSKWRFGNLYSNDLLFDENGKWKQYYFLLGTDGSISCKESHQSTKVISVLRPENFEVRLNKQLIFNYGWFVFEIVTPYHIYQFKCNSQEECNQWMSALQKYSPVHAENDIIEKVEQEIVEREKHTNKLLQSQWNSSSLNSMRLSYFHKLGTVATKSVVQQSFATQQKPSRLTKHSRVASMDNIMVRNSRDNAPRLQHQSMHNILQSRSNISSSTEPLLPVDSRQNIDSSGRVGHSDNDSAQAHTTNSVINDSGNIAS